MVEIRTTTGGEERVDTDGFIRITTNPGGSSGVILTRTLSNPRVVFDAVPAAAAPYFVSGKAEIVRFVDIYEADNVTPWRTNVGVLDGSVTVDMTRDERRVIDITIAGEDGKIVYGTDELWYDKIIKPYRGVTVDGVDMVTPLGEFQIDRITRPHFPNTFTLSGRDFTKKLLKAKLPDTTSFSISTSMKNIIETLAVNGGIPASRMQITHDNEFLPATITFERLTPRWDAIKQIANSFGYEVFFDNFGIMVVRKFIDPLTAPVSHTFQSGSKGNIVDFQMSTDDSLLYNHVVVYGSGNNNRLIVGQAENTQPSSPTRIERIGRRTDEFASLTVANVGQAQAIAQRLLSVSALEQYDASLQAIVAPWLEAGDCVEFLSPNARVGEPTRFLLSNFNIPLGLSAMSAQIKRVTVVS